MARVVSRWRAVGLDAEKDDGWKAAQQASLCSEYLMPNESFFRRPASTCRPGHGAFWSLWGIKRAGTTKERKVSKQLQRERAVERCSRSMSCGEHQAGTHCVDTKEKRVMSAACCSERAVEKCLLRAFRVGIKHAGTTVENGVSYYCSERAVERQRCLLLYFAR